MKATSSEIEGLKGRVHAAKALLDFSASGQDKTGICLQIAMECLKSISDMLNAAQVEDENG